MEIYIFDRGNMVSSTLQRNSIFPLGVNSLNWRGISYIFPMLQPSIICKFNLCLRYTQIWPIQNLKADVNMEHFTLPSPTYCIGRLRYKCIHFSLIESFKAINVILKLYILYIFNLSLQLLKTLKKTQGYYYSQSAWRTFVIKHCFLLIKYCQND